MNDPHVTALHYWVEHDDSVDYDIAVPLDHEDELVKVHLEKGELTLHPKEHTRALRKPEKLSRALSETGNSMLPSRQARDSSN